jgi:GT2 family glycosyltransferase
MKLSIVILCWNDLKVISGCLKSIFETIRSTEFEVIVSDNDSKDGSIDFIRQNYPAVRIIENRANLGFARGNNVGIAASRGEYVLVLNADTILHEGTLDNWVRFADQHPEAGGFGCRVLNPDGSYQCSARPFPNIWRSWLAALYLRPLAHLTDLFVSDTYTGWNGDTERWVDWQSGCCVMFRSEPLKKLGGFDGQFFYHFEEVDLCRRFWQAGSPILFTPAVTITHLGGQSADRRERAVTPSALRLALEAHRNRYRFFYKHYGRRGARQCRRVALVRLRIRQTGRRLQSVLGARQSPDQRLVIYRACIEWNRRIDPVRFVENGEEPELKEAGQVI